jgi:hypothetical protein
MPCIQALSLVVALLLGTCAVAGAQTTSGPDVGSPIQPLKVAAITGDGAGDDLDFAARRQGRPTVFAFVQADKWDRPIARFLSVLDKELSKDRPDVAVVAVWLTDDVEKAKDYLPLAQQSLRLSQTTLAVWAGDKNGPPGWSINSDAHLTLIVADNDRASASFAYRSVNETNVPEVLQKLPKKQ